MLDWLKRYGPPEIFGTLTALAGAWIGDLLSRGNPLALAYGGAIGENLGFYGVVFIRELRADARRIRSQSGHYRARQGMATVRKLLLEFGPSELLDTGVVRPLAMGLCAQWLGREIGVVVGKLLADVSFYLPVVLTYELRRMLERRNKPESKP